MTFQFSDPIIEYKLEMMKKNFVAFIEQNKTIDSPDFEKYRDMSLVDFLNEMSDRISHYKMFTDQYLVGINDALGLGANENPEIMKTLREFLNFFSDIIDIISE